MARVAGRAGLRIGLLTGSAAFFTFAFFHTATGHDGRDKELDRQLQAALKAAGFRGDIESGLEKRLGRRLDKKLAEIGRMLWFDTITGLNDDNTCGGCHSPTSGFGDTQSIAIGIESNRVVGPGRIGPRNQRRSPTVVNAAFYPNLMWNSRFAANSGDPFNNRGGFTFPVPEGASLSYLPHLLLAQAFIPPVERTEAAGFHFQGGNEDMRAEVVRRLNATSNYRKLFGEVYRPVREGRPITMDMFAAAIAEFEFTLTFADAPIDRFARGRTEDMSESEKRGGLLFFGKAGCVKCHAVGGKSNDMFSDFKVHVAGVPQVSPTNANILFDGPAANEDFGLEQVTGNPADRYKFRTSPLRNVALQPAFFHNGAYVALEEALRHHLNPAGTARAYRPTRLRPDLRGPLGPIEPVLARLDPLLTKPVALSNTEFKQLFDFVRTGLLDRRARSENLRKLIPSRVPSGRPTLIFEGEDRP